MVEEFAPTLTCPLREMEQVSTSQVLNILGAV